MTGSLTSNPAEAFCFPAPSGWGAAQRTEEAMRLDCTTISAAAYMVCCWTLIAHAVFQPLGA